MNDKANELGLSNTNFVTPHGLDNDEHYTTAYELAIITDYALGKEKIREVVSTQNCNVNINGKVKNISNTNELLGYLEGVNGVKTGFTNKAGRCLVTSANRDGLEIITVVLGADTKKIRTSDSIKLIEYAYKNYQVVNLEQLIFEEFKNWRRINEERITVNKGKKSKVKVELGVYEEKEYVIKNDDINNIWFEVDCRYNLEAPIYERNNIGELKVNINNNIVENVKIVLSKTVERKNVYDYIFQILDWI